MAKSTELNKLYKSHSWEQVDFLSYENLVQANKNNNLLATELCLSLDLIGGASGICHFLAISGLALAWAGGVGRGRRVLVPGSRGRVPPPPPEAQGLGARAGNPGGRRRRRRREAAGKAEKGQARRRYFNLINDRTPLRVCFNNQDTLQQVDRMFAVNLHMSSVQAVSINNV